MERSAATRRLYPDLRQLQAAVHPATHPTPHPATHPTPHLATHPTPHPAPHTVSSVRQTPLNLPPHTLLPSAPPPDPEDLDLDPLDEPTLDYTLLDPDYDMDDADLNDLDLNNVDLNGVGGVDVNDVNMATLNNLNLSPREKAILHDKNIQVPQQPEDRSDLRAWVRWRLQANKLLAALILLRQGRDVILRRSEIRRPPLSRENMQGIVREARAPDRRTDSTSLAGCPYIMYGIPRVRLNAAANTTTSNSRDNRARPTTTRCNDSNVRDSRTRLTPTASSNINNRRNCRDTRVIPRRF